jgi:ABC-2 type transport system ATP-binding protein
MARKAAARRRRAAASLDDIHRRSLAWRAVIVARSLTKRFGPVVAVDDLSFEVRPGIVTGFLGPNGAGKTTTLRMLLGLAQPTSGTATVEGMPYARLSEPARTVGAVLERAGFHPGRSGRNHLRVQAEAARLPHSRADEVLALVGLTDAADRRVGGYSLGMRQRLALASAMLGDPRVLLLDEPANGLDPQGIRWLRDFLRWLASEGRAVFVSSHVLSEMAQTVDEVIVIHRGRLVTQAPVAALTAGAGGRLRVRTPHAERFAQLLQERGLSVQRDGADGLQVPGGTGEQVGPIAAENGIVLYELTQDGASLEDVFFDLTGTRAGPDSEAAPT